MDLSGRGIYCAYRFFLYNLHIYRYMQEILMDMLITLNQDGKREKVYKTGGVA